MQYVEEKEHGANEKYDEKDLMKEEELVEEDGHEEKGEE